MNQNVVDFLDEKDKIVPKPKRKLKLISKVLIYLLIIFVIFLVFFGINVISSGENLSKTLGNVGLLGQIKQLIGSDDKKVQGLAEDRINILLLGMGGVTHEGPYLTDTIILSSIKPSTNEVSLISIPRDFLAPIPGYGSRKINHANAFGEAKEKGQGGVLASQVISDVFAIPIHYYVRIDFDGFKKIIDDLGGVNIEVENVLDDPFYPIPGKETATTTERYDHLYIDIGNVHMDGDLALKYVRSRQARGIEGSDFARSKRQQKVITAVKEKGLSFSTLVNPYKISNVTDTLSEHLSTNLQVWEIIQLFNIVKDVREENIVHRVFDDSPGSPLYSSLTEEGAFVIQPKAGDFSEIQFIAKNIFDPELATITQPKRIEIQNGTRINGLASQNSEYLQSLGYQVIRLKNAPTQDYVKTVIYNLTDDPEEKTVLDLSELLKAEVSQVIPEWVTSTTSNQVSVNADILIILGQDRNNYDFN